MVVELLIKEILDCAREVRKELKQGFEEKVYKDAMFYEMKSRGLQVDTEVQYAVHYKNHLVGKYFADMVVNECVVIELKANTHYAKQMKYNLSTISMHLR